MKKVDKIKVIYNKIFNKIFKVSSIEELEEQRNKMQKTLNQVQDEKNRLKGLLNVKRENLLDDKRKLKLIEEKIENYVNKNNTNKAQSGYELKIQLEKEIDRLVRDINAYSLIIKNTDKQIKIYETKINKIMNNIDELKAKEEFTNNAKKFRENMSSLECKDIKDITDEINRDYYAENYALEDIEKQDDETIDNYIQDDENNFKKYVEKIQKKNKSKK